MGGRHAKHHGLRLQAADPIESGAHRVTWVPVAKAAERVIDSGAQRSERPATEAQLLEQQRAQFVQWSSLAEVMAYYELLKKQLKVQIKVSQP